MLRLPNIVAGVAVEYDPRDGRWVLSRGDERVSLRPWSWGERRRLVDAAVSNGTLHRALFVDGVFDALTEPRPGDGWRTGAACTCLTLLRVPEAEAVLPLADAEVAAIRAFHWLPRELDAQPAATVDRLLERSAAQGRAAIDGAADEGWTRIVFTSAGGDGAERVADAVSSMDEARLARLLATVERWAGLVPEATARTANAGSVPSPAAAATPTHAAVAPPPADASARPHLAHPLFEASRAGEPSAAAPRLAREEAPAPAEDAVAVRIEHDPDAPLTLRGTARPWSGPRARVRRPASAARDAAAGSVAPASGEPAPFGASRRDGAGARPPWPQRPVAAASAEGPGPVAPAGTGLLAAPAAGARVAAAAWGLATAVEPTGPTRPGAAPARIGADRTMCVDPERDAPFPADVGASDGAAAPRVPFTSLELEEQLADVLERAAEEAGVDLT